jgi:hypothetical protein
VIATWITLAGVLIALATLILGIVVGRKKLDAIHIVVNSRYDDLVRQVARLIAVLKEHGIDIPEEKDVGLYLLAMVPHDSQSIRSGARTNRAIHQPR